MIKKRGLFLIGITLQGNGASNLKGLFQIKDSISIKQKPVNYVKIFVINTITACS